LTDTDTIQPQKGVTDLKLMFASAIHGSRGATEAVLRQFKTEKDDRLVLLGALSG